MNIDNYTNIAYEKRGQCMICGKKADAPLIDLPDFPITEIYIRQKPHKKAGFVDQGFYFCEKCGHGQMQNVIDINLQYGGADKYHFRTSASRTAIESVDVFLMFFNKIMKSRKMGTIVEIGCNDLYLLKSLKGKAYKLIGIDPILKGKEKECSKNNIIAIGEFYEDANISEKIDVIICKDTLEHLSDPKQMFNKMVDLASDDTILFFEIPLLDALITSCRFDQVYHQHLNLFSFQSIIYILKQYGFKLLDYTIDISHLGSIIIAFKKARKGWKYQRKIREMTSGEILDSYEVFKSNMSATNRRLLKHKNEQRYGYGAALMLPVLSYYLKNDLSCLKCIIDDDKSKEGLYYINLPVSIKTMATIKDIQDSVVLITAISSMNNVRKIMQKLFQLNPKHIILPLNTI